MALLQSFLVWLIGTGVGLIGYFEDIGDMLATLILISLLILMSTGWGIRGKSATDNIDLFIPVMVSIALIQILIMVIDSYINSRYWAYFSDYDGILGYMVIVVRLIMMLWFVISAQTSFTERTG
jgi:hypothetical protein